MLSVFTIVDRDQWNSIVKSFKKWDIYYLYEYAYSFMIHGDGDPLLFYYSDNYCRFCIVAMKSDIANSPSFSKVIGKGEFFDLQTPYGYGGPLSDDYIPYESQIKAGSEIREYCKYNRIVSLFVRFHPLLSNYVLLDNIIETQYLKDTIFINTSSDDLIMSNMDSKNRNMVRKAIKSGVSIYHRPIDDYLSFKSMYEETMHRDDADDYYYFKDEYFEYQKKLDQNACIFYASLNGSPISGAILYYNDSFMHYHLSGSIPEFRKFAPSNLLLYKAACWACEKGIKQFHLGGGLSSEDSLFGFKKQFNKNGRVPFYIGRMIFDNSSYKKLLEIRMKIDNKFNINNTRMIQYR